MAEKLITSKKLAEILSPETPLFFMYGSGVGAFKKYKCNQCHYASSLADDLRIHLKRTVEKSETNATNATMLPLLQAI